MRFRLFILASLVLCLGVPLFGQGYSLQNFSQFTNGHTLAAASNYSGGDGLTLAKSWYGTGAGDNTNIFSVIQNSAGALTIQNTAACADGDPPNHTGKYLDYNTTLGTGTGNQILFLGWPGSGVSTVSGGEFWFCSTIPVTDVFGTTFDGLQVISSGGSRLSNYTSNGSSQGWNLEGSGVSGGSIPYTPNTTVRVVWQHVSGAACGNTDHSDCVRLQLYTRSGTLLGENWANLSAAGTPSYATFGNGNAATMSSGHHVQYSDIRMYTQGFSAAQFPTLSTFPSQLWDGLITYGRGTDWTQAGIKGFNTGTLPSSAWTQCGSPLAAGNYTGGTISTTLAGCSPNTYYKLGIGTFNIDTSSSALNVPSNVELRGSGAHQTFLVGAGSGTPNCGMNAISSVTCISAGTTNYTQSPGTIYNWTAGYAQGTTQITLSSVAGISPGMLIVLDQCDTGLSGATCGTGTVTDNSNLFICGAIYSSGNGCSFDGPDAGGSRVNRQEMEVHTVVSIVGSVVTINPPVAGIYASGSNPEAWVTASVTNAGITDLSIDVSAAGVASDCANMSNAYNVWISGVRCTNNKFAGFNAFLSTTSLIQSSYVFNSTGTLPSNYGIRKSGTSFILNVNNILQGIQGGAIFDDGSSMVDVDAYNYVPNSNTSGDITPLTRHAFALLNLYEGNIAPQVSCDNIHGTCGMDARFRNHLPGWQSNPSTPVVTFVQAISDFSFARYMANIDNVLGTPTVHTSGYTTAINANLFIYNLGSGGGAPSIPTDTLTKSTTLNWANYNVFDATVRDCGNALDTGWVTPCGSASESPVAASTFPNFVPVLGDTAIGQGALPPSFIFTSRPAWWDVSIPFPAIGSDVTLGNVSTCNGTINTVGKFALAPATNASQCAGLGITASAWGGHVNAIPAMVCASGMGLPVDGSGSAGTFNADACFSPSGIPSAISGSINGGAISGGAYR